MRAVEREQRCGNGVKRWRRGVKKRSGVGKPRERGGMWISRRRIDLRKSAEWISGTGIEWGKSAEWIHGGVIE
jgi:hypothetical protein